MTNFPNLHLTRTMYYDYLLRVWAFFIPLSWNESFYEGTQPTSLIVQNTIDNKGGSFQVPI